jgi:uncharacterized protein involved in response to NO
MKIYFATWKALASAPHRLFFLGGVIQGIAAILWWLLELWQRFGGSEPLFFWTLPAVWAHAYLMVYGFFPFFIFGFLFTFFPNWLDTDGISYRDYVASFSAMSLGTVLFYTGLIFSKSLLLLAVLVVLFGWTIGALALIRILLPANSSEKKHLALITLFVCAGAFGLFSFFLWLLLNNPLWLHIAGVVGVWFFVLPLVVTVSHLVIPFFSRAVIKNYRLVQPFSILSILLAGMGSRGLLEGIGLPEFFWIPDLVLLIFASYLSFVWDFQKSIANKMLFMLHLSFAWFSIGVALDLIQSLTYAVSQGTFLILGHAPLHALTLGFFSSMVIGISTRVTFGHSGRQVSADSNTWMLFLMFQGAASLRVLADLFSSGSLMSIAGYEGSALLWIGGFFLWVLKYGFLLWQPAPDHHL